MMSRRSPGRGWGLRDHIALRPCPSPGNTCPAMRIPLSRRRARSARDYGSRATLRSPAAVVPHFQPPEVVPREAGTADDSRPASHGGRGNYAMRYETVTDTGKIADLPGLGRIGKLNDPYPGNPEYYATPTSHNPFDTLNGVRTFRTFGEARSWLAGIADSHSEWLRYALGDRGLTLACRTCRAPR
jgi:hypothetical protein